MKRKLYRLLSFILVCFMLAGCSATSDVSFEEKEYGSLSEKEALSELSALLKKVDVSEVENPQLDIYMDEISEVAALADISTFDITVQGRNQINIEIAAATELTADAPDDWINVVAKKFNNEGMEIDGKSVSVTVRKITSGEAVTYITKAGYQPEVFIPSNEAWGKMIEASGIDIEKQVDRIAGNTAGILISKEALDKVKTVTVDNVLKAASAGDITFAYTNPYTSSTGLNMLTQMLYSFDNNNPLSSTASSKLMEYQKTSPPVAYTTAVLRNQAKKGLIDTMVMEEQAYINTPELSDYTYVPFGIRHDHPVYTFSWTTEDEEKACQLFIDYCLEEKNQKLASDRGFNLHDDYKDQDTGMSGQDYVTAQSLWKDNKTGGRPVVAMFVADISGSMKGEALSTLQQSLIATLPYIGSEHYVGLLSYSSDITINLPIAQFDDKQRAYFSGEVKNLIATGGTNTYEAVLVALDCINKKTEELPDAVPIIILLTDGEANGGYTLSRISPVVDGLKVPVYCIAYNYNTTSELRTLSEINEASVVNATTDDIVNQLRNLFNTQL